MKDFIPAILLLISFILGGIGIYEASRNVLEPSRPVKIATIDWEPYVSVNMDDHGPVGKLIMETIHRMGYLPELTYSSWGLGLERSRKGNAIGTFPAIETNERKKDYYYSDTLFMAEYVLFFRKDQFPGLEKGQMNINIQEYKVGKVKGYEVWDDLEKVLPDSVKTYPTLEEAFVALGTNEIQFLPECKIPALSLIQNSRFPFDASNFTYMKGQKDSLFGSYMSFHFIMNKQLVTESFRNRFNEQLDSVMENTSYLYDLEKIENDSNVYEMIELKSSADQLLPQVYESPSAEQSVSVLPGTQAVVLKWGDSALFPVERSKIKILNGPLKGRILWAASNSIFLTNAPD